MTGPDSYAAWGVIHGPFLERFLPVVLRRGQDCTSCAAQEDAQGWYQYLHQAIRDFPSGKKNQPQPAAATERQPSITSQKQNEPRSAPPSTAVPTAAISTENLRSSVPATPETQRPQRIRKPPAPFNSACYTTAKGGVCKAGGQRSRTSPACRWTAVNQKLASSPDVQELVNDLTLPSNAVEPPDRPTDLPSPNPLELRLACDPRTIEALVFSRTLEQLKNFPGILDQVVSTYAVVQGVVVVRLERFIEVQNRLTAVKKTAETRQYQSVAHSNGICHVKNERARKQVQDGGPSSSASPASDLPWREEIRRQEERLRQNSMENIRYRPDIEVKQPKQRRDMGLPARSPIHPLAGNRLTLTKQLLPGIHTPFCYESSHAPGAPFLMHLEDYDLTSVNILYQGRKIWVCIYPSARASFEARVRETYPDIGRCSQFIRHACLYFPTALLDEWNIPYAVVDQRAGDVVVTLPGTYHQGFSLGYTKAEAINYAGQEWSASQVRYPCSTDCTSLPILQSAMDIDEGPPAGEGDATGLTLEAAAKMDTARMLASYNDSRLLRIFKDKSFNLEEDHRVRVMQMIIHCEWPEQSCSILPHPAGPNLASELLKARLRTDRDFTEERFIMIRIFRHHEILKGEKELEKITAKKMKNRKEGRQKSQEQDGPRNTKGQRCDTLATEEMIKDSGMTETDFKKALEQGQVLYRISHVLGEHVITTLPVRRIDPHDLKIIVHKESPRSMLKQSIAPDSYHKLPENWLKFFLKHFQTLQPRIMDPSLVRVRMRDYPELP
ncbi:unnamed protein product [Clonostachys rosea]|uniref:JmjC domain-containing protein n=1 Tax=Bionectria ochroleuca TaxID=29856 RepID=A0ABY6U1X4_BIOOC|nr:unnamed protein product [Clonostachys rosea]